MAAAAVTSGLVHVLSHLCNILLHFLPFPILHVKSALAFVSNFVLTWCYVVAVVIAVVVVVKEIETSHIRLEIFISLKIVACAPLKRM